MSTVSQATFLFKQEQSEYVEHCDAQWEACAYSRNSPFKETCNEDAIVVIPVDDESTVFAIADGCGGMRGGEQASSLCLQMLCEAIEKHQDGPDRLRFAIIEGIERANNAIQELKIGAACTIAVVECTQRTMRPYHVGDSMILATSNRGRLRYQSVSHSPVGFAVESGMLCADEAMHHEDRHLVSNVVGHSNMRIEMGPVIQLSTRDTILIASDGLFDNLNMGEVVEQIRKGKLQEAVQSASELAHQRMLGMEGHPCKPDDISMVAIRLNPRR
jgi:PPM family protein phosphatase